MIPAPTRWHVLKRGACQIPGTSARQLISRWCWVVTIGQFAVSDNAGMKISEIVIRALR